MRARGRQLACKPLSSRKRNQSGLRTLDNLRFMVCDRLAMLMGTVTASEKRRSALFLSCGTLHYSRISMFQGCGSSTGPLMMAHRDSFP